jgi:lysozyme
MPTPNDVPTIGYGSTGPDIKLGMTWTIDQCEARFASDVDKFARGVDRLLGEASTTGAEFGAMVSLAYNIGLAGFGRSSVLRLHKIGDHKGAARAFGLWNKQAGAALAGLTRRRAAEAGIYLGAVA